MQPTTLEEQFRTGDEGALSQVYRRYAGAMYATAYQLLGDRELAADAVQQAFVQAWRAAPRFDPSRGLQPWLYAITRRAAIDTYRRNRRESNHVPFDDAWTTAADGPSLDATWQTFQVRRALDRLPADERRVLELAYRGGLTQTEIADALGIAVGTVKSRTARAQRRLAGLLAHLRDASEDNENRTTGLRRTA